MPFSTDKLKTKYKAAKMLKNYYQYGMYFSIIGFVIQILGFIFLNWRVTKLGMVFTLIGFAILAIPIYLTTKKDSLNPLSKKS